MFLLRRRMKNRNTYTHIKREIPSESWQLCTMHLELPPVQHKEIASSGLWIAAPFVS